MSIGAGGGEASAPERLTYTVPETAARLGVSTWHVYQQVRAGTLPAVRLGRRVLISRAALELWLAAQPGEAAASDAPLRLMK